MISVELELLAAVSLAVHRLMKQHHRSRPLDPDCVQMGPTCVESPGEWNPHSWSYSRKREQSIMYKSENKRGF